MFRFKFIFDNFQDAAMSGPYVEANMRAKWLPRFCPSDLEIAFAPDPGQIPIYPTGASFVPKDSPGWWNHYIQDYTPDFVSIPKEKGKWSMGPNMMLSASMEGQAPMVAYSNYHKYMILNQINYPADLIHIIPNMIDYELFYPRQKNGGIIVGWMGHDENNLLKGPEVMPFLARRFPHIQFEMILSKKTVNTDQWLKEDIPNLKMYYGVPHHQIPEIMGQWHVLVSGSKTENCPNQIMEAMTCGIPVIAAAMGGIPEIASSQMLLYDMNWGNPPNWWTPECLEKYALALQELLSDQAKHATLSQLAIQESRKFTPELISMKWFEFMYKCRDFYSLQG